MQSLIEMINKSFFAKPMDYGEWDYSNNIEGVLLLQIALQNMPKSSSLAQYVPDLIGRIARAMLNDHNPQKVDSAEDPKLSLTFRKVMCQAILSCLIFDHDMTITTMDQLGFT